MKEKVSDETPHRTGETTALREPGRAGRDSGPLSDPEARKLKVGENALKITMRMPLLLFERRKLCLKYSQ